MERAAMASLKKRSIVDATKLSLDEWLSRIDDDTNIMITANFPTLEHQREFLVRIDEFDDKVLRNLLRHFLPCTGTHPLDLIHLQSRIEHWKFYKDHPVSEYPRRLFEHMHSAGHFPVWEGIHWILDLLPHWPREAIRSLRSFEIAECQFLPDNYLSGIRDAMSVIRRKYIVGSHTRNLAKNTIEKLEWREFEYLVAVAWKNQGYRIRVTRASKDGGIDVFVSKGKTAKMILIQCKHWARPVGTPECHNAIGVMELERANQSIIVTSGTFSKDARKFEKTQPRLRLVDGHELIRLLNGSEGPEWPNKIDGILTRVQHEVSSGSRNEHL